MQLLLSFSLDLRQPPLCTPVGSAFFPHPLYTFRSLYPLGLAASVAAMPGCLAASQIPPQLLLTLNGFEQRFEIPLAKTLRPLALDDLEE